jgi:histone-lysine N-methyltransferase SETMAR
MVRPPHPPYLPDLAPSDFFLSGYLKSMLQSRHFETGENRVAAIIELAGPVEKPTLDRVFLEWVERFENCIGINSEDVGGDE